jgi:hypothetical protein
MALPEQLQPSPVWAGLPEKCRREVMELLVQLLRSVAARDEKEVRDE